MSAQAEADIEELVQEKPEQAQEQDGDVPDEPPADGTAGQSEAEDAQEEAAAQPAGEEDDPWAEALAEQLEEESTAGAESAEQQGGGESESYSPAPLDPLEDESATHSGGGKDVELDLILDIPVTIAMEIGRTKINIRNLLQLNQGSVVELDRLAGEPLDVMVNGKLIAHGEVVVVNEKFGIRLTDVVSPQERIKNLKR